MQIFKSRVGAVVAGAAVLALATGGGAAFAEKGDNPTPPGHDRSPALQQTTVEAYTAKPVDGVVAVAPGTSTKTTAECAEGYRAIGGGFEVEGVLARNKDDVNVLRNQVGGDYVDGMFTGWEVEVYNGGDREVTIQPSVICAAVG